MSEHYSLLQMQTSGVSGPLAGAMQEEVAKYKLASTILKGAAALKSSKELELLGLDCEIDQSGAFHAKPTGVLGDKLGAKIAEGIEKAINGKGWPILHRDGKLIFTMYQPAIPSAPAMKVLASRMLHDRTGHPRPATATLQVTTRCQADCFHCSAAKHKCAGKPEMDTDTWKSILRQTEDIGVVNIVFTGGEPMLRSDIYELISWVRKDESNAMMFTNGLLLTDENVKRLVDAGLFSLNVSIDSPDAAAHNELRRVPNCFEKALEGLQRAKDAGIVVGISTYATPERLHNGDLMRMIELSKNVGAHELTVFDVVPTGKLLSHEADQLLSDGDKDRIMKIEEEWNAKQELPHIITQAHVNGPRGAGCYAGWFQFYMTAYGDVMPCDFTPLTVGNATNETIADLWVRLANHSAYAKNCNHCRMQDAEFRAKYIDHIPDAGPFPYPIAELDKLAAG